MLVLIAKVPSDPLHSDVLRGLASQDIPVCLITAGAYPVHGNAMREVSINRSREVLHEMARHLSDKYVLLLDSDVVLTDPTTVSAMMAYLDASPEIAAVSINTKGEYGLKGHVLASCCLIRMELYRVLDYSNQPTTCQCSMIAMRTNLEYLETISAYEIDKIGSNKIR